MLAFVRSHRFRGALVELFGLALVVALAFVAVAHVLGSTHAVELLRDGDSLAPAVFAEALGRGDAGGWTSSQVLFVFAEIPIYLVARALTPTVAGGLVLNAVFNVVLLYALVRAVLSARPEHLPGARSRRVLGALVVVALFALEVLTESTPGRSGPDVGWMYLTGTYYSGSIMAMLALLALSLRLLPRAGQGRDGRRIAVEVLTIVVAAGSCLSNPMIVVWGVAPVAGTVLLLWLRHRIAWRAVVAIAVPIALGTAIGYGLHVTVAAPLIHEKQNQTLRIGSTAGVHELVNALRETVHSGLGALALAALAVLWAAVAVGAVRALRGPRERPVSVRGFVAIGAAVSLVVVAALFVVGGATVVRYAQPALYYPLVALGVWVAAAKAPGRATAGRLVAGVVTVGVVVAGAVATPTVATAATTSGDPSVSCLDRWVAAETAESGGRTPVGVAQFWGGRTLEVYGSPDVRLVQVYKTFAVRPWITSSEGWDDLRPSYVVESDRDPTPFVWSELGGRGTVTRCDGYRIHDLAATEAGTRLDGIVRASLSRYEATGSIDPAVLLP